MTEKDQIKLLRKTLKSIAHSADYYITDGSWIDALCADIANAEDVLKVTHPNCKVEQSIRDAVGRSIKGEK